MNEKMKLGNWLALLGLSFATFIFNTSEFVPIGLLTDIKNDFGLTEASVGMLISLVGCDDIVAAFDAAGI